MRVMRCVITLEKPPLFPPKVFIGGHPRVKGGGYKKGPLRAQKCNDEPNKSTARYSC